MSGLSHTPGKRARGKTLRGFESRLLRQIKTPPQGGFFICRRRASQLLGSWQDSKGDGMPKAAAPGSRNVTESRPLSQNKTAP